MSNLRKHIRSDKWKWALTLVAMILIIGAVVALFVNVDKLTTTKTLSSLDYGLGKINETGIVVDADTSIVSKDIYTVDGIVVEISGDANITYRLAFYNEDEEYISTTEALNENFDVETIPENATLFRVEITPNQVEEEDVTMSVFDIPTYANQLTVTFNK